MIPKIRAALGAIFRGNSPGPRQRNGLQSGEHGPPAAQGPPGPPGGRPPKAGSSGAAKRADDAPRPVSGLRTSQGSHQRSVADGRITGHTEHGLNQSISRDGGRGVNARAKLDAVRNPKKTVAQSGGRTKYVGKEATVVTNKDGKVITTYGRPRDPKAGSQ